ncbi:MAG TPA: PilZ domain-containing protein [Magnetospirillaceae bacterium]|nr:PilZ domain-containing protein [Magnetospirillaceae bacterium]
MAAMTGDLHRRQYVRVPVSLPVEFSLEGDATARTGSVLDLGAGGMRLVAPSDVPPRATLDIKFRLPGHESAIRVRGRAVLSAFLGAEKTFHHGIAFTSIDPEDRRAIADFVDANVLPKT